MGVSPSKSNAQHQPRAMNFGPYGRPLGPVGAPNFGPSYALPNGQFIPGYIPNYGNIPPQVQWSTQGKPRKRRKTRKTREGRHTRESDAQDHHVSMPAPHSAPSLRPPASGTPHAPVVPMMTPRPAPAPAPSPTPGPSIRRIQTPYRRSHIDDEEDDEYSPNSAPVLPHARPQSGARVRSPGYAAPHPDRVPSRGQPRPLYQPQQPEAALHDSDMARALEPLEPAHSSAFGPSERRSHAPLRNPLPPPPRDLYETSPYKSLLTLPQTTALLTANFASKPPAKDSKKSGKGLFRAFTSRKHTIKEPEDPKVHFVPVFINNPARSGGPVPSMPALPPLPPLPPLPQGGIPGPSTRAPGPFTHHSRTIRYNEDSEYWSFMNHSPHRIIYDDKEWPTATHLVEARKYLPQHPEIAEEIRLCGDVGHVYPISANYQQFQDPHWSQVHMQVLEDVLYLKFSQHADLRSKLWETEDARLIYDDRNDPYWGVGPMADGSNVHGQLMERVRTRLLEGRIPQRSSE